VVPDGSEQTGTLVQTVDNPGSGGTDTGNDFTNFEKFDISGKKYLDVTGNGITSDDTGLGGVTIDLFDHNGTTGANTLIKTAVTDSSGNYSFTDLGPLAAGHSYFVQEVVPTNYVQTAGNDGYSVAATSGHDTSGENFANYKFVEGSHGLTQGFWSTHEDAWNNSQDNVWANIVDKTNGLFGDDFSAAGVKVDSTGSGKKLTYLPDSNDDIIWALSHNGGTGFDPGGILLGDANGNGKADPGEVTSLKTIGQVHTDFATSSTGDARVIMLNQLDAAQLNIYNGDKDPGSYNLSSKPGHDLVGEGVMWLQGNFSGTPGTTSADSWNKQTFDTGQLWTVNQGTHHIGDELLVSGQDLKNVLQAFNQNQIVTSSNGQYVGWSGDGGLTIVGIHANTPDAFWQVAAEHHVIA
jgi:SdrD B-like domain